MHIAHGRRLSSTSSTLPPSRPLPIPTPPPRGPPAQVRLTFKSELGQVWVGSAASTQKVPYGSIHKIQAQPIKGQEEYSIVRLQLGASGGCG